MKPKTIIAKVAEITYKGHSYFGNPHYTVNIETIDGEIWYNCKTTVNGSIGYGLTNYCNKYGIFTYHETRNGSIILEFANDIN